MKSIDLNVDLGEGGSHDAELLDFVSSANIACGGHAGGGDGMVIAIELAVARGVMVGAHPGYEDRDHFGRKELRLPMGAVRDSLRRQLESFLTALSRMPCVLHHVKPHGALYNQANHDAVLAETVVATIHEMSPGALLYVSPAGALARAAQDIGMKICAEGFADRRYRPDGTLAPRDEADAVIADVDEAAEQAMALAQSGKFQTLCVHGDGSTAVDILRKISQRFYDVGIAVQRPE